MRHVHDDLKETSQQFAADDVASLDEHPVQVSMFLADLRALGGDEPPAPSAALEALFAGSGLTDIDARRRDARSRRRRVSFAVAAAAITTVGLTGVAAANDTLPQPAQRVVSRLVNDLTPFHIGSARVPSIAPVEERAPAVPGRGSTVAPNDPMQSDEPARGPAIAQPTKSDDGKADSGAASGGSGADGQDSPSDGEDGASTDSGGAVVDGQDSPSDGEDDGNPGSGGSGKDGQDSPSDGAADVGIDPGGDGGTAGIADTLGARSAGLGGWAR